MMKKYSQIMKTMPVDWLLEGEPYVRYRTLTDLLDQPEDADEVIRARKATGRQESIKRIFKKQNPSGFWGEPKDIYTWWPKKDTTFWLLGVLADFGFNRANKRVAKACEYVFSTQHPGGGFGWSPPATPGDCFTGILVESLAGLGYRDDPRLVKAYNWLADRQRLDGGFWCKGRGLPGGPREKEPSCAMATLFVMGAVTRNPKLSESAIGRRGINFLLDCWKNRDRIKYAGHDSQIGRGWEKPKYPFTDYRILKYLDVLSRFKSIKNKPGIPEMLNILTSRQDEKGRYFAESIHKAWSDFDFGQKKLPSRWITFLTYRIIKRLK